MKYRMYKAVGVLILVYLMGCSSNESDVKKPSDFTGKQVSYALVSGSEYNISGTAVFKERNDHTTQIDISLNGINGGKDLQLPVHLHLGDVSQEKANIAALLNPVDGGTGKSQTILKQLADESLVVYSDVIALNACIKIHLATNGDGANVILSAGNIGSASTNARSDNNTIAVCKSE
jgi:hypothetical protein